MAKTKPVATTDDAEEIFGGYGLLDRLGKGRSVVETPSVQEEERPISKKASTSEDAKSSKHHSATHAETESKTIRISVYLTPEDLDALDQQVIASRRRSGRKKDRSELIREAVRSWLATQH
jgi:hypothetical protein